MKFHSDASARLSPAAMAVLAVLIGGGLFSLAAIVWAAGRVGQ